MKTIDKSVIVFTSFTNGRGGRHTFELDAIYFKDKDVLKLLELDPTSTVQVNEPDLGITLEYNFKNINH